MRKPVGHAMICVHGYAHRITNMGVVESAPTVQKFEEFPVTIVDDWHQRNEIEMDLTGGDISWIRDTLQLIAYMFPDNLKRLPTVQDETVRERVDQGEMAR